MTDPFELLGQQTPAITPRAAFAEQLRRRIENELQLSADPAVPDDDETGYLFYFTLPAPDADQAARFYRGLFDWDLDRGDGGFHVNGVYPPMGLSTSDSAAPEVWIEVADVEATVARVRQLGGTADDPVQYDSGLNASCRDDQGVMFNVIVPDPSYRQGQARSTQDGELFYWTLPAPDAERSKTFYNKLFGWRFGEAGSAGGMNVENKLPDGGLGGGREGTHPDLFFRVSDLESAMARVAELGGTATEAGEGPEGRHAMCSDDQGTTFGLSQPADGR